MVDSGTNTSKFYRTYAITGLRNDTDGKDFDVVAFHWGRIGSAGQWQVKETAPGFAAYDARDKMEAKLKKGYDRHPQGDGQLSIVPEEIIGKMKATSQVYSTSLDLGTMLSSAQSMTVALIEGRASAADVVNLRERAKQAKVLQTELEGRLEALQMLVVAGVGA
jgi:predicted DNA-binding WGR domain protein